jgi:hypothetical protein
MPRTKEERSAYNKAYSEKNKARIAERKKAKRAARSDEEIAADKAKDKARKDAIPKEEKKAKNAASYQKNKAKFRARYQENKVKNAARDKVYRDTHKEEKAAWSKDYKQTPAGRKAKSLSNWKGRGIICDDWDALYEKYLTTLLCEQCNVELTTDRYNTETTRTLDHNHDTHLFRNVLCHSCNVRRDVRRKARSAAGRCRNAAGTGSSC